MSARGGESHPFFMGDLIWHTKERLRRLEKIAELRLLTTARLEEQLSLIVQRVDHIETLNQFQMASLE